MNNFVDIVIEQLIRHEGKRNKPYRDTVGKLSIGIGRNLDDVGLRDDEIYILLENDIETAVNGIRKLVRGFDGLTENRKAVLVNMMFNMGYLTLSKFSNTLKAVEEGRYEDAAKEMENSKWYKQVKGRAVELVNLMRVG